MWLQQLAGILAIAALVVAVVATFLVARVAWPLYGGRAGASVEQDGRWLRRGLASTFLALALLAAGTATSWWPQDGAGGDEAGLVSVQAGNGESVCGRLGETSSGLGARDRRRAGRRRAAPERGLDHVRLGLLTGLRLAARARRPLRPCIGGVALCHGRAQKATM